MNIPKFSVDNHVLLSIVLATLLVLGVISVSRLPQEQFSEVPFFWVNITVPYPGATSEDIERSVTLKVEQAMQGIDNLKQIQSVTSEGLSVVRVEFNDGIKTAEFERLFQEVQTRFSRVTLPEGTLQAFISDFSSNDFLPVIELVLTGADYGDLDRAAVLLRDRILSVPDVSDVAFTGRREQQVIVAADRSRLESVGLGLTDIVRAVQQKNVAVPGGILETETREYLLRTVGNVRAIDDLERIVVRSTAAGGTVLHVGDVANITSQFDPTAPFARFDGNEALILSVTKVPRGNAIRIIERVKSIVQEQDELLGESVVVSFLNDSTVQIRDSIDVLISNAVQGLILLTLILFLFLGFRNAAITAFGIPVTFAITFVILELLGETINTNTLFGMVLVLGMIVDHAIVITENTYRLQLEGRSRLEAAIEGASQVAWPIVASALTTIAAFLPLMILPGTIGKFLRVIPLVVTVALAVSTVESILFIPSHVVHWPGVGKPPRTAAFFETVRERFTVIARFLYRHRLATVGAFFALVVLIFSTMAFVRVDLFSAEDFSLFYIDITMPAGANKDQTERVVREYEARILPRIGAGEVTNVRSVVGRAAGNRAEILLSLVEQKDGRTRAIPAIMEEIRLQTLDIPGADSVQFRKAQSGPPTSAPIGFRLRGDDYTALTAAALGIEEVLAQYSSVFNIEDTLETGTPELQIRINPERAAAYGLSAAAVGSFIRGSYDGFPAGSLFVNNEEIDIIVRFADPARSSSIAGLMELKIPAGPGRVVPFSAVARLEESAGLAAVKRVDGKREVGVNANIYDKRQVQAINREVRDWYRTEFRPANPGVELVVGGEFSEFADLLIQILRVFVLGIFLIYAVLGAQFKSYTQPFLILLSVPMAFAGVILYLALSGTPFSTTVLYAAVALAGIAVNDTIVLIDFINTERSAGVPVADAVIQAVSTRLRPILLTSITTIAGLLPTALGFGGYSVVWSPMASTIIFGLVFSTLTAITVVPAMYGLLYDRVSLLTLFRKTKADLS